MASDNLPHDIRLIAAVSRLIDIHQSRRDSGGAYVPEVPDKAGSNLFLALVLIDVLHEIEMDRGIGYCPINELASRLRKRYPEILISDIEFAIANLKQGREIHYGVPDESGNVSYARTWDTTPLIDVQEGFSQIQLTENARLLLRISAMRESWLYSDLDADRLIKALERGQFQDIPEFCRAMSLDLAAKSKQLSGVLERPSLAELRGMLIAEGERIAEALNAAALTISQAIERAFSPAIRDAFDAWSERHQARFYLGNLQAEMELVLQNVEALSRRFLQFLEVAQKVKNDGVQSIQFLEIAERLVIEGSESSISRIEHLLSELMPWGIETPFFHPGILVGEADLKPDFSTDTQPLHGFTVDPSALGASSRFQDFLRRNSELVISRLKHGPLPFSELMTMTGFSLQADETPLDFFGVYASPDLLSTETQRIVVGLTDLEARFTHSGNEVACSDPMMFLEVDDDPS
ncbi:hypothetical protein [Ferrigenium kumadai]|uniref:hypothetical protein n=1 Tax=Ferrigenium kumadai TaxID=1682490 RepID=UPI001BB37F32|nr:hypothetical protein [Ferrigenium kumadai]